MGVIQDLEQKLNFTETERVIANYMLENADRIPSMGIVELAVKTYSSNAAIIRLCRKLGLAGYKELRVEFATDYEKLKHVSNGADVDYPFIEAESPGSIMRSIANITQSAIEECYAQISPLLIQRAARILKNAQRVYIYAAGETLINTTEFANLMLKIGKSTVYPARYLESVPITTGATANDAALVVSYTGYLVGGMSRELRVLKRQKTPVIVVSSLKVCPEADLLLSVPDREHMVGKVAGFYSQAAIKYVLNCLYGNVYAMDLRKNRTYKDSGDSLAYTDDQLDKWIEQSHGPLK